MLAFRRVLEFFIKFLGNPKSFTFYSGRCSRFFILPKAAIFSSPFIAAAAILVAVAFFLIAEHSPKAVFAEDYTSTNFILRDPVITDNSGRSTSQNFEYLINTGQAVTGESTSGDFVYRAGFLYFPSVVSPIVSATAGDAKVTLSWTAATTSLGFSVSGYQVGYSAVSGGPYTYSNVGNVLTSTVSSLTNGTTYYFVVRVLDAFTSSIATSGEVSGTPTGAAGGGGGGGSGYVPPQSVPQTTVIFSGRAYPKRTVTLLKDAQVASSTVAYSDAQFEITLTGLTGGNYIFAVYSEDSKGRRSSLLTFPVGVTLGAITRVSGIFIAPTIDVDKAEVKRGDNIAIFGQSAPDTEITISVASEEELFVKAPADKNGVYLYNFDTSPLEIGEHFTKSKAALKGEISSFGNAARFQVGVKSVSKGGGAKCKKADLNCDGRVNLVDFSIAAYWYKRPLSASFKTIETDRLNGDGKIDLVDFSIMAYYWTG